MSYDESMGRQSNEAIFEEASLDHVMLSASVPLEIEYGSSGELQAQRTCHLSCFHLYSGESELSLPQKDDICSLPDFYRKLHIVDETWHLRDEGEALVFVVVAARPR
ncbi:hypothetical protein NE237_032659 [Protea cynaroides]|uniref:Uncharacterized protein n=1 Tax=Protea cynaroides TaxID=273540 RepID=A0A9Q0R3P2_9MAGN|nr:hypothetical protein NE237_032659 [Protea cynaroides]